MLTQVGTLVYNANPLSQTDANGNVSGSVTLQDVSSSSHDYHANGNVYYSGAVEFNGSMANGTVSITADNNVTPTSNVVMKYIVRKWNAIVINNVPKHTDVHRRPVQFRSIPRMQTQKKMFRSISTVKSQSIQIIIPKSWMVFLKLLKMDIFVTGIYFDVQHIIEFKVLEPVHHRGK